MNLTPSSPIKRTLITALMLTGFLTVQAQEKLPREEALKYAFFLSADLPEMLKTPIPTDPDVKRPVAMRDGDHGGLVLPETKLNADTFTRVGKEPVAVGQLWLVKLAPMKDGQAVSTAKLRTVHVHAGDHESDAVCCALAVRKDGDRGLELLVYGKDKEPLIRLPLESISGPQDNPIEFSCEKKDNSALVTLKLVGKYAGTLRIGESE